MKLKISQIENLIGNPGDRSNLADLILEYAGLKQNIQSTETHSWYFKKGMESKMQKLASISSDFETIKDLFNRSDMDFFIEKVNEKRDYLSKLEGKHKGFVQRTTMSWGKADITFINELIRLKSKTEMLMPIEYYLKNPEELLRIID